VGTLVGAEGADEGNNVGEEGMAVGANVGVLVGDALELTDGALVGRD